MAAALFDTLDFSHQLMDAGMSRKQAEKIAAAQKKAFENQNEIIRENLKTIGGLAFCVSIVFKLYF